MIDAKELRIGNLITQGGGHILEVTSILTHGVQCFNKTYGFKTARFLWNELIPIPITPKWLAKWGFTKGSEDGGYTKYEHPWLTAFFKLVQFDANGSRYRLSFCAGKECYSPSLEGTFQHVHDLQNFFFAIVRKEITDYKSLEEIGKNWK